MSSSESEAEPKILVVEDNPIDVHMIKLALKSGGFTREPSVVDDGVPALAFLRQESPFEHETLPDLIILDLNLKRIDGPEILAYIRETRALRYMPVVILSSSPEDVMRAKAAEADCYISKPSDLEQFLAVGNRIKNCYSARGKSDSSGA